MRSFAFLALASGCALADIKFSRTIEALNIGSVFLTVDGKVCSSADKYGSNECDLQWGASYTGHVKASLAKDIEKGSTITVDAKVDGLIPLKFTCPACGANCTITVPIVGKTETIELPPCPLSAASLDKALNVTLPSSSPIQVKTGVKGEVTLADAAGATLIKLHVEGAVTPSAKEAVTVKETDHAKDAAPFFSEEFMALMKGEYSDPNGCSATGDCGKSYQACCIAFGAKGYPCGCHLTDGTGTAGSNCGDCGTEFAACCIGFSAKGYPCKCNVA